MSIREPLEDFVSTTLAAVPGWWQKLVYLSKLRVLDETRKKGKQIYDHWGMLRRYGPNASQNAMRSAHSEVFIDVLRQPTRELLLDLEESAKPQSLSSEQYIERVWEQKEAMLPENLKGGSAKHFEVTLLTLRALLRRAQSGRPQPGLPPPPLDR